jgi:hypothetical protein
MFFPTDISVKNFINQHNVKYQNKLLHHYNYPRVVSLSDFYRLSKELNLKNLKKVAVVSGSKDEPELNLINFVDLDILQFNEDSNLFNLDDDWKMLSNKNNSYQFYKSREALYDFVFCNQVFEHIYSPIQGINNIKYILKKFGYIWISLPTINCIHGNPHFYTSGYHPRYLKRLCEEAGLKVIQLGAFGNRKYLAYAVQGKWLTHDECKIGLRSKIDFAHFYFAMTDGRKNDASGKFITDTWILCQKI